MEQEVEPDQVIIARFARSFKRPWQHNKYKAWIEIRDFSESCDNDSEVLMIRIEIERVWIKWTWFESIDQDADLPLRDGWMVTYKRHTSSGALKFTLKSRAEDPRKAVIDVLEHCRNRHSTATVKKILGV